MRRGPHAISLIALVLFMGLAWLAALVPQVCAQDVVILPPRPLDRKFPTGFCPFEFTLTFVPTTTTATLRFWANVSAANGPTQQGIDNICVVKETVYNSNKGTCSACPRYIGPPDIPVEAFFFNRSGLDIAFLERFDTDPIGRGWNTGEGAWWNDLQSAPANPEAPGGTNPPGFLRLGGASGDCPRDTAWTSITVGGLTAGTVYVLSGWWYAGNITLGQTTLVASVDTGSPNPVTSAFQWNRGEPFGASLSSIQSISEGNPRVASDDRQGAYVAWTAGQLMATHIDAFGRTKGPAGGKALGPPGSLNVIGNGQGDAIVAWGFGDIRAQRINPSVQELWGTGGLLVCNAPNGQSAPVAARDDLGGAFIAWLDSRSGTQHVYAQRVDGAGQSQWMTNGLPVCTAIQSKSNVVITADGAGGALIAWVDFRAGSNPDIYAQRVASDGTMAWAGDGAAVCVAAGNQLEPQIVPDGTGGAYVAWVDGPVGQQSRHIFAQRITSGGNRAWTARGVDLGGNNSYTLRLLPDGVGNAWVIVGDDWSDDRIRLLRLPSTGAWTQLATLDVIIDANLYGALSLGDAVLRQNELLIGWGRAPGMIGGALGYRVQKIIGNTVSYNTEWPTGGVAVTSFSSSGKVTRDGAGGAIVALSVPQEDGFTSDAVAQRVDRLRRLGSPEAQASGVRRLLPTQQQTNCMLRLSWNRSYLDRTSTPNVNQYKVWTLIDPGAPQLVATVTASRQCRYSQDIAMPSVPAGAASFPRLKFWVDALNTSTGESWPGPLDSTFIIDTTAPPTPTGLRATYKADSALYNVCWHNSPAPDFHKYHLHTGQSADFTPSPQNLSVVTTAACADVPAPIGTWFKLATVDSSCNVSEYASLNTTVGVGDPQVPQLALALHPNPARGTVVAEFSVPIACDVQVAVFDVSGRRVQQIFAGEATAGGHRVELDMRLASGSPVSGGVFFVRMTAAGRTLQRTLIRTR